MPRTKFGDLAELRKEKANPKDSPNANYIGLEHIAQQTLRFLGSGKGSDVTSQKQKFYQGDILFGKLRPYFRKVVIAPFDGICSTDIWVVRPRDGASRDFIYYWMASSEFIRQGTHASEGGRMPRAKWDWVSDFEMEFISLKRQISIGNLLSSFDKRIANHYLFQKHLENYSFNLFKEMFVNIDGSSKEWKKSTIGDEVKIVGGATPSTSNEEFWTGENLWLTPKDLSNQEGLISLSTERKITLAGTRQISSGILPRGVVLMSSRAPIGYLTITGLPASINQGFIGLYPTSKFNSLFLLNWIKENMEEILIRAGGGTFDEINRTTFKDIEFMIAKDELLQEYSKVTLPMQERIVNSAIQTQKLVVTRDLLIDRIFSGELIVPEELQAS